MHLNMKRLGSAPKETWSGGSDCHYHRTDSIQCGVSPEIHAECNGMEKPLSWDLSSVSRRTRMEVGWRVRWGEESSTCKGKERIKELGLFRKWQLTQYEWKIK